MILKTIPFLILFFNVIELTAQKKLIKEGHRGCRGLMPENTITSMKKALDLGVDVLEVDVVISADNQVVVSHDPYMAAAFCLKPNGDTISVAEQKDIILYRIPYSEIKKYDVGSRSHAEFPQQQHFKAYKPLLAELIDSTDAYARHHGMPPPRYNIEIKSNPKTDGIHQPVPEVFVDLVLDVCRSKNIMQRMNIQSFDVRPLQAIRRIDPNIELAYLTANAKTIADNIKDLGFTPQIYSPHYKTVTRDAVMYCHKEGMRIIPWTVNTKPEIDALIELGVDGIITDYPNLFE